MVTLSITPDYLGRLIAKVRGLQAREGLVDEDSGSNASDDRMVGAMQDSNAEPEEWEATVEAARNSRDMPTERYLLTQPLTGEYWAEGAERLGVAVPVDAAAGS
jgi:hypothetical protein